MANPDPTAVRQELQYYLLFSDVPKPSSYRSFYLCSNGHLCVASVNTTNQLSQPVPLTFARKPTPEEVVSFVNWVGAACVDAVKLAQMRQLMLSP